MRPITQNTNSYTANKTETPGNTHISAKANAKPVSICRVNLPPVYNEEITYEGRVCSHSAYTIKCTSEVFTELQKACQKQARDKKRKSDDWPGVLFDQHTHTVEIHLNPIMAKRFLNDISANLIIKSMYLTLDDCVQSQVHEKYATALSEMANAWHTATQHLIATNFKFTSPTGATASKRVLSQFIDELLENGSFCIAEANHIDNLGLLHFLKNNMAHFKAKGVKTLKTEYLAIEVCQAFAKQDGSLDLEKAMQSDMFLDEILRWPNGREALEVLKAAHEQNIRIVGIDSYKCYPLQMDDFDDNDASYDQEEDNKWGDLRLESMNCIAMKTNTEDDIFIVWAGAEHLLTCGHSYGTDKVRGINMAFNIPSIVFSTGNHGEWGVYYKDEANPPLAPECVAKDSFDLEGWNDYTWDAWVTVPEKD